MSLRNTISTTSVLALTLVIVAALAASSSSQDQPVAPPAPAPGPVAQSGLPIPDWVLEPPQEPGMSWHGVGSAFCADAAGLPEALRAADDAARRDILQFLSFNDDHQMLRGSTIIRRVVSQVPSGYLVFSLGRIAFDSIAESLQERTKEALEQVQRNAESAFEELDRLLLEEEHSALDQALQTEGAPGEQILAIAEALARYGSDEERKAVERIRELIGKLDESKNGDD